MRGDEEHSVQEICHATETVIKEINAIVRAIDYWQHYSGEGSPDEDDLNDLRAIREAMRLFLAHVQSPLDECKDRNGWGTWKSDQHPWTNEC